MELARLKCMLGSTIKEAMVRINGNTKRVVIVVNEQDELEGIMTEGDIRRLLINGVGMNEKIDGYVNRKFTFAFQTESNEQIRKKFSSVVKIIPIVNEKMELVDFAEYDENLHIALAQPQLNGNEYKYLMDAFLSTWISSTGKYIDMFETGFSKYCGTKYGVATSNGTVALHLALAALGIGEGDEVIVPDLTFAATINAVLYTGATPVIVDIEKDSWCIDPDKIERSITAHTKAIIPVHLYGQPCDMGRICEIAEKNNLFVIEDCAEAHGAEWNGKKVGAFGIISCFSFFGNKVVTTGEGGMCLTNDKNLSEKMRIYRDHGMSRKRKYYHEVVGFNYRMTNLQAAIGTAQVERIDGILAWREKLEQQYREKLGRIDGVTFQLNGIPDRHKIAWLVSILVDADKRDGLVARLKENGIDVRSFFIPLSKMKIYEKYAAECPNSGIISQQGINLPTTNDITVQTIDRIYSIIKENI